LANSFQAGGLDHWVPAPGAKNEFGNLAPEDEDETRLAIG
jgi:hypothetical protein